MYFVFLTWEVSPLKPEYIESSGSSDQKPLDLVENKTTDNEFSYSEINNDHSNLSTQTASLVDQHDINPNEEIIQYEYPDYTIDRNEIKPFEFEFCPEWFMNHKGKQINKTPTRYVKIRNHILDLWEKMKPSYVSKSRIRPGLKGIDI